MLKQLISAGYEINLSCNDMNIIKFFM